MCPNMFSFVIQNSKRQRIFLRWESLYSGSDFCMWPLLTALLLSAWLLYLFNYIPKLNVLNCLYYHKINDKNNIRLTQAILFQICQQLEPETKWMQSNSDDRLNSVLNSDSNYSPHSQWSDTSSGNASQVLLFTHFWLTCQNDYSKPIREEILWIFQEESKNKNGLYKVACTAYWCPWHF